MMDMDKELLVQEYMDGGCTYEQACAMAGVLVPKEVVKDVHVEMDFSDDQLVMMNGSLAVRVIHQALQKGVRGGVDNTVLQAAVRAVQMFDEARKRGEGEDAEDDMLRWVAEVNAKEREKRREVLQGGNEGGKVKKRRVKKKG